MERIEMAKPLRGQNDQKPQVSEEIEVTQEETETVEKLEVSVEMEQDNV
jgi:hypothetical protein